MSAEIIIGLGGLVLSAITYFAGVKRAEARLNQKDREERIEKVLGAYMEFRHTNKTAGLDGLQKAGVANLESTEEINLLIRQIIGHAERDPLGGEREKLEGKDLKKLFDYAAAHAVNFHRDNFDDILERSDA